MISGCATPQQHAESILPFFCAQRSVIVFSLCLPACASGGSSDEFARRARSALQHIVAHAVICYEASI